MEKDKSKKQEKEKCPLCEVSEETIKRLKEKGLERKEKGEKKK